MKTLIYIISSPRSGSTLLANILGNSSNIFNVGELTSINGFINNNSRQAIAFNGLCSCGAPFKKCNFWKPILNKTTIDLGINKKEIDTKINMSTDFKLRYIFLRRYLRKLTSKVSKSKQVERSAKHTFSILDQVTEASHCDVVVDSSKNLLNLISYSHYLPKDWDLKIIFIKRSPGATAYSVRKAGIRLKLSKYYSYFLNLIKSIHFNNVVKLYLKSVSHLNIYHEDLCLKFPETQKAILDYLDNEAIKFLDLNANDRIRHDIGGSVSINKLNREIILKLDSSWKKELTFFERIGTWFITTLLYRG